MPIINRALQTKRRERVIELLTQGHTNKQIAQRVRVGERTVLRLRKKLLAGELAVNSR
jgi:DNA-binding NarL/FixJ family response regulator